jgi:hypothetical protein
MSIKPTLELLLAYYRSTRGVGHTKALLVGAVDSDCVVLTDRSGTILSPKKELALSSVNLIHALIGNRRPMLLDNSATMLLLEAAIDEISKLERKVERLQKQICLADEQSHVAATAVPGSPSAKLPQPGNPDTLTSGPVTGAAA